MIEQKKNPTLVCRPAPVRKAPKGGFGGSTLTPAPRTDRTHWERKEINYKGKRSRTRSKEIQNLTNYTSVALRELRFQFCARSELVRLIEKSRRIAPESLAVMVLIGRLVT